MEFNKYSSLASAQKQKVINAAVDAGHSNLMYGVTEKIHGANFGIHWDRETDSIKFSRRTGFLEDGETFYSHTKIEGVLVENMKRTIDLVKGGLLGDNFTTLSVYGEICGGGLNGVVAQGSKRVQKEVQYSPETEFVAFDMIVSGVYAPQAVAFSVLSEAGFQMAPLLALYESLEDALRHPNDDQSVLASLLGYEVEGDNVMEGVVIRPWNKDIYLFNGSHFILKNKNVKFMEKEGNGVTAPKPKQTLSKHDMQLFNTISDFINTNRLNAVISKEKELTQKHFGRIMGLLVQDAMLEYSIIAEEDGNHDFDIKEFADCWKGVVKALQGVATLVVRAHWTQEF